jgi:DNA-binding transcriptional LysR family regulator
MNWQNVAFDWNQARAFLATAEEGTLSAAARGLGLTQPTLSRQVAGLEAELGVALFERIGRSLQLTPAGTELLEHFRAMGEAAGRASLVASGKSQAVEGLVTITASDAFSVYFLPQVMVRLRQLAPGITVDIVASNTMRDLQRREADIAVRHVRPDQPELIAKLIHKTTTGLFASPAYLDRMGRPKTPADLAGADFIGFAPVERLVATLNQFGLAVTASQFKLVTDNGVLTGALVREGLGIGVFPLEFAGFIAGLERVLPDWPGISVPFWLTCHRDLLTSRRIRLVFDLMAEAMGQLTPKSGAEGG